MGPTSPIGAVVQLMPLYAPSLGWVRNLGWTKYWAIIYIFGPDQVSIGHFLLFFSELS